VKRIPHHFFHVEDVHIKIDHGIGVGAAVADMQKTTRRGFK
jgi:hypothetical protein